MPSFRLKYSFEANQLKMIGVLELDLAGTVLEMSNYSQYFQHALNFARQLATNTNGYKTHNIKRTREYGPKTTPPNSRTPQNEHH